MKVPPLSLLNAIAHLNQLLEQHQLELARPVIHKLRQDLAEGGYRSASFVWLEAVFHDHLEDFGMALTKIAEAAQLDPCNVGIQRSREVICSRLRSALHDLTDHDRKVPELHRLLGLAGATELEDHLKLARYHAHHGRPEVAHGLLDAILALNPVSADAWAVKSMLLGVQGRCGEAQKAAAEASRWGFEAVPFSFSGLGRA
jgi:hypothetical protein